MKYLLNDLRNFNEIFREDVAYDNDKSHKKLGLHPLSRTYIFGKTTERYQNVSIFFIKALVKRYCGAPFKIFQILEKCQQEKLIFCKIVSCWFEILLKNKPSVWFNFSSCQ